MFVAWGQERTFFYNDSYALILGKKHPKAFGETFADIWSDIWSDIEPLILSVEAGEAVYQENLKLVMNRFGYDEETYFTFSYSPILDDKNQYEGLFCAVFETTQQVHAEERLKFALASAEMGTWTIDLHSGTVSLSEEACRIVGIEQNEIKLLKSIDEFLHPDDRQLQKDSIAEAIATRTNYRSEFRFIHGENILWVLSTGRAIYDGSGTAVQLVGLIVDITERKNAERIQSLLRENAEFERQKFASIFAESPAIMALVRGPDFIFERTNAAYESLMGHRDLIGKPFVEAVPELKSHPFFAELTRVYQTGEPYFAKESLSSIQRAAHLPMEDVYLDFTYQKIDNPYGDPYILGTAVDVTEKVRAREAIQNEFRWLELVLNKVEAAILLVDPKTGNLVFSNEAAAKMTGGLALHIDDYTDEYHFVDEEGRNVPKEDWPRSRAIRGEIVNGQQFIWRTPKGTWEYLIYAGMIAQEFGRSKTVLICMLDITDLRQAERKLERSEAELRTLANAIPQLAWMADPDGTVFWYNERWYEYTGKSFEHMQDMGWQSVHHPDFLPSVRRGLKQSIATGIDFEMTFPLKGADGKFRWFLTRMTPLKNHSGRIIRWFGTNTDVQKEREIALDLKLKSDALENSLNGFDIVDENGLLIYVNQAYLKMWGYGSSDEVLGTSPVDHCADPETPKMIITELKTKGTCDIEFIAKRKDGSTFDVRMLAFTTYDSEGREIYPTTSIDITDQKRAANALILARDEAERANQLKSAFLANMSHEIRTPLGVLIGFADLISDPSISSDERQQYADTLKRNGEQLTDLVNDVLDLSKVEAGYLSIESMTFPLREVLDDVISGMQVKAKQKGLRLHIEGSDGLLQEITCDRMRLKQILFNLIGNAVKFTDKGQVVLRVVEEKDCLVIEVQDSGIGISSTDQEKLFKPFSQADESMTRKFGGTGLGLALSKKLAELMGGALVIKESQVGVGSIFSLRIKTATKEGTTVVAAAKSFSTASVVGAKGNLIGRRVLVVDDSADNQLLISRFLTKRGAEVEFAENGLEAMERALNNTYDIVIMDIQMPVMDGYTATQKLRELGFRTPIIALTAHALSDIRQRCLDVGYNDYAPKPINLNQLYEKIISYL